ncbi:hypothetical protein [Streptomyces sp. NPDC006691]|uniref:hypothetical protein n=1 Tax=Streptomyces sp. NPDC006691 TaxID=3364757 RepID=UPI0036BA1276
MFDASASLAHGPRKQSVQDQFSTSQGFQGSHGPERIIGRWISPPNPLVRRLSIHCRAHSTVPSFIVPRSGSVQAADRSTAAADHGGGIGAARPPHSFAPRPAAGKERDPAMVSTTEVAIQAIDATMNASLISPIPKDIEPSTRIGGFVYIIDARAAGPAHFRI